MSEILKKIIQEFSKDVALHVANSARDYLIQSKHTLSAEDSGLANTWEEICVQVQDCRSYYWEAYDAAMRDAVLSALFSLDSKEKASIWLQTEDGLKWLEELGMCELDGDLSSIGIDDIPVEDERLSEYLISQYLDPMAFEYTNENIESFLDRGEEL